ncbi:MAG: WcaI family glycosyltransferase [Alphaproteobacteria bacterium]|nr:WcaI family glycosyltransferase [Alphaproteobacteria bacterium]
MKILLLCANHAPEQTGTGKYQGEMAAWLAAQGHEVRVVAAPPYYPAWKVAQTYKSWLYRREKLDGCTVYRVPLYVPAKPTGLKRLVHLASYAASSFPLCLWLGLVWRPDALLVTEPTLMVTPAALCAGLLGGARTYLHVQDFEVDAAFQLGLLKKPWLYRLALKIERFIMRRFTGVSTISPNMRKKLLEKGVEASRAFLIPNWSNVEAFDPAKGPGSWAERFKKDPSTILVVYSGNLGNKQGLETLVQTARILQNESHLHFIISGDGAARPMMEEQAQGLSNLTFLPVQPMEAFVHLMIAADIHMLPQKAGAADLVMPSKLCNILASGRPVVAGAAQGTQVYDAVQGCGLAVEPENAASFADAILTLAKDGALRAQMGAQGRAHAQAELSKAPLLCRMERMLAGEAQTAF